MKRCLRKISNEYQVRNKAILEILEEAKLPRQRAALASEVGSKKYNNSEHPKQNNDKIQNAIGELSIYR